MKFDDIPERYVDAATVQEYFGISGVTLWRWQGEGMPVHQTRNHGRRYFKLSECDRWFLDFKSACTDNPAGSDAA